MAGSSSDHDAAGLVAAAQRGQITVRDVVVAHLTRMDALGPDLNAVVTRCDERAVAEAEAADRRFRDGGRAGPLHGLVFTAKDALDTTGVRTTAGSPAWAERVPDRDAAVVARMRSAGAILIGKTNCSELTLEYETDNDVFGRTRNPYDLDLSPGGSSGGAAAVAAGLTPVDLGTDTGGSIRLPAHFCGIAGLKASFGRVPRTGLAAVFGTPVEPLVHVGPLARSVGDLALVLEVIEGPDGRDPGALPLAPVTFGDGHRDDLGPLRIAYYSDDGVTPPTPEVAAAVHAAAAVLGERGAEVRADPPPGLEAVEGIFRAMFLVDGYNWVGDLLAQMGVEESRLLPRGVKEDLGPTTEWTALFRRLDRFRRGMLAFLDDVDVIVAPVHPEPAREPHVLTTRERRSGFAYAQAYNLTGWPVVAVRAGTSPEGLPIGVQVVAGPGRDDLALRAARAIEADLGGYVPPDTNDPGR